MAREVELEYIGKGYFVPGYPARDFACDEDTAEQLLAYKPPVYRRKTRPPDSGPQTERRGDR